MAIKDILNGERGLFALLLVVAATVFVCTGHITFTEWKDFALWVFGVFVAGKTITTAAGFAMSRSKPLIVHKGSGEVVVSTDRGLSWQPLRTFDPDTSSDKMSSMIENELVPGAILINGARLHVDEARGKAPVAIVDEKLLHDLVRAVGIYEMLEIDRHGHVFDEEAREAIAFARKIGLMPATDKPPAAAPVAPTVNG